MKFKVGDKVKVKRYKGGSESGLSYTYVSEMEHLLNKICKVVKISGSGRDIHVRHPDMSRSYVYPARAVSHVFKLPNHLFEV